jgi:chitosanase
MGMTDLQKETAQALVQIFETSKLGTKKAYSVVTLLKGDTGGLTYGKHQTTINSGNLYLMLKAYTEDSGADFAKEMATYLPQLAKKSSALASDSAFKALLAKAGQDSDMQDVQDAFFDRVYWQPAVAQATAYGFTKPLAIAVIYDSFIHGSWKLIRDRTTAKVGAPKSAGENLWIRTYNAERRAWLANHSNALLRKCVYRQDAFAILLKSDNWDLGLPMTVRGVKITREILGVDDGAEVEPLVDAVAETKDDDRLLSYIADARMNGDDVLALQVALTAKGYNLGTPDRDFGAKTDTAVRAFQKANGLRADGIVGAATRAKLGLD